MRHHPKFLLLFLSLFIAACSQGAKFDTLAGEPVSLAGNGKWQVINYWASWCTPCRVEHPQLEAMAEEGIVIYGINYKDNPGNAL
ncbi:MAG: redoxin family protein, partial [Oceanisphaera sp.]|nr:redoxin family protein [Oceanisphaera sp.]